jgi:hypothetical protein
MPLDRQPAFMAGISFEVRAIPRGMAETAARKSYIVNRKSFEVCIPIKFGLNYASRICGLI